MFVCFCGKEFEYRLAHIMNKQQSCGCRHGNMTHGQTLGHRSSSSYATRVHMIRRCTNTSAPDYYRYGGRGIKVCDRWLESFENFFADMGTKPTSKHSLDRIDNNGDYCPENCRWATNKEQSNNTRVNHMITYKGETLTLTQWCERLGLNKSRTSRRIIRSGWPIEAAFEMPYQTYRCKGLVLRNV